MTIKCSFCNSQYVHKADNKQLKKIGVSKKYSKFVYSCISCQKNFTTEETKYLFGLEFDEDYSKSDIY